MATITSRKKTYIIGKPANLPADAVDVSFDTLAGEIEELANQFAALDTDGQHPASTAAVVSRPKSNKAGLESLVVEMTSEVKDQLETKHGGAIFIEEDEPLFPLTVSPHEAFTLQNISPNSATESLEVRIVVRGPDSEAVPNARVTLSGLLWVDHAITDRDGRVTLSLLGETIESISQVEVKPAHTYWSFSMARPRLAEGEDNQIVLSRIADANTAAAGTSQHQGWGQDIMGLANPAPLAAPVRVAVIDSGLAADHSDLTPVGGFDFGDSENANETWSSDGSGHGTHVSGICGAQNNDFGILGFAPGAELFGLRVFPNASNAKLIRALDWCIDNDVDVINMSLGGRSQSPSVQQRLQACRQQGILPVAAAGNDGGAVLFPAAFPEAMAVAAIGKVGSFPSDSGHQKHVNDKAIMSGNLFVPRFTCRGPEIDVCAPGVAIVSCVPENGYAAWDGTSMASPHVAGFAARLLQLQDELRNMPRDADRSQALFDAIVNQCTALPGVNAELQGSGLPSFARSGSTDSATSSGLERLKELLDQAIDIVESEPG